MDFGLEHASVMLHSFVFPDIFGGFARQRDFKTTNKSRTGALLLRKGWFSKKRATRRRR